MENNNITLAIMIIFFSSWALISLISVLKPEILVNLTLKWFKMSMKLYGFEAEIKPTPRAKTICRIWNLIMFCIDIIFLLTLPKTFPK